MWTIVPVVFCVCLDAKILPQFEATFHNRINVFLEVVSLVLWLVKQQQHVPIAVLVCIATST